MERKEAIAQESKQLYEKAKERAEKYLSSTKNEHGPLPVTFHELREKIDQEEEKLRQKYESKVKAEQEEAMNRLKKRKRVNLISHSMTLLHFIG